MACQFILVRGLEAWCCLLVVVVEQEAHTLLVGDWGPGRVFLSLFSGGTLTFGGMVVARWWLTPVVPLWVRESVME